MRRSYGYNTPMDSGCNTPMDSGCNTPMDSGCNTPMDSGCNTPINYDVHSILNKLQQNFYHPPLITIMLVVMSDVKFVWAD